MKEDRLEMAERRIREIQEELERGTTPLRRGELEGMMRYYESHKQTLYFYDLMGGRGVY